MNNRHLTLGVLAAISAVSCTVNEVPDPAEKDLVPLPGKVYYATIEDEPGNATRTLADEQLHVLWHADDRVTLFENLTYGKEYRFAGEDKDPGGPFEPVPFEGYIGGSGLDGKTFAIYPHHKETKINTDGVITYQFPGLQTYLPNSFGRGANPMMAQADGQILRFKNVGGYLCFKLYGENVSVSSLTLEGNGGEPLSGEGAIVINDGLPVVTMNPEKASNKVVLYCNDPVELGPDAEHYTTFWFVLPPGGFSQENGGFTLTVSTSNGKVFTKSAAMDLEIERNSIKNMAPLAVVPTGSVSGLSLNSVKPQASNVNYKTTYDANSRTYTVTMPTVTDFSGFVFNYDFDGDALLVNGEVIENGVTPIDASQSVSLTVRSGNKDVRYTLEARNTGLPVVRITTDGFTREELESYQNSLQSSDGLDHRIWLPDAEKYPEQSGWSATVRIENPDGTPGMGGEYEVATQIKGRGNYTWKWEKKPYALKLASNVEVLGMLAHKRWVLLANWRDRTLLRNDAAFWLSKQSYPELPYTTKGQFVELEFNGEHRGNYYLCEQIKIDPNRVNITALNKGIGFEDLSGGYLMEIDSYWDELNKFRSAEFNLKYMFKEPDDAPTKVDKTTGKLYQKAYSWMENYIGEFERVLKTESAVRDRVYENYLDVNSAIMFMLLNELTGNRDFFQNGNDEVFGPHSTYLYKDKGGLLFMGPGWDFDYETFIAQYYINQNSNNGDGWRGFTKTGYYYHYLSFNPMFVQRIKDLWNGKKATFRGLTAYINQMAEKISLSQEFDEAIWPYHINQANRNDNHDYYENWKVVPFTTAISRMTTNFEARVNWMDDKINKLSTTSPEFKYQTSEQWPSTQQ